MNTGRGVSRKETHPGRYELRQLLAMENTLNMGENGRKILENMRTSPDSMEVLMGKSFKKWRVFP